MPIITPSGGGLPPYASGNEEKGYSLNTLLSLNNVAYAKQFSGSDLSEKINNGFNAGYTTIKVEPQSTAYEMGSEVVGITVDQNLIFENPNQDVNFTGGNGTDGVAGNSDICFYIKIRGYLSGGNFTSVRSAWDISNPWELIRLGEEPDDRAVNSKVELVSGYNFEYGVRGYSTNGEGITYNDIGMKRIQNCYRGVDLATKNTGSYINENNFYINMLSVYSDYSTGDEIGIRIDQESGGDRPGNNKFWHTSIEGQDVGTGIKLMGAQSTQFYGPRVEDWGTDLQTTKSSAGKEITQINPIYSPNGSLNINIYKEKTIELIGVKPETLQTAQKIQDSREFSSVVTGTSGTGGKLIARIEEGQDWFWYLLSGEIALHQYNETDGERAVKKIQWAQYAATNYTQTDLIASSGGAYQTDVAFDWNNGGLEIYINPTADWTSNPDIYVDLEVEGSSISITWQ